jgi:hypothetical protein
VEREEEAGGDAEERVAAAARGRREVERWGGGGEDGLEGEYGEPPLAHGVAGGAARRGPVHGGGGERGFWEVLNLSRRFPPSHALRSVGGLRRVWTGNWRVGVDEVVASCLFLSVFVLRSCGWLDTRSGDRCAVWAFPS